MANLASTLLLSAGAMLNLAGMPASGSAAVDLGIDRCDAAFFEAVLPNGSTLEKVARVAEGGTFGEGASNLGYPIQPTNLPSLCAIIVNVTSSPSSSYRFGLMLPDSWNERFLAVGNGGFAGGINWLSAAPGTHYGFASLSTDTGHNSSVIDVSWALNAPEKQTDWGWRSMHGSVTLGKALTAEYYGSDVRYSYYSGCSTGGRQGLKEVQISPESFDGALVGAAAWDTDVINNYATAIGLFDLPVGAANFINYTRFPVLADEVVRQCDGADGVLDGIVSAPQLCDFDYGALQCGSANVALSASECFTAAQVQTLKNIYNDWRTKSGEFLYPGLSLSSEDGWYAGTLLGWPEPSPFGVGYQRYFLYNDPDWPWQSFNDSSVTYAEKKRPGQATAAQYDISAFRDRGGKVLMYHGIADGLVVTKGSELYYKRTKLALGCDDDDRVGDFFRLFLIPGMGHCLGSAVEAPWYIAGEYQAEAVSNGTWSVPGFRDARHDALLALMQWTEHGEAPDQIIATAWNSQYNTSSGVLRQRPLCPFPAMANWDRRGDINEASSWSCGQLGSSP